MRRPDQLPRFAWGLLRYSLTQQVENGRMTPAASEEYLRVYVWGFQDKLTTISPKAAIDWAFDQIPDPVMPEGYPAHAWNLSRQSLVVRQRFSGLAANAAVFEAIRKNHNKAYAILWALGNAAGQTPGWLVKKLLNSIWKTSGLGLI